MKTDGKITTRKIKENELGTVFMYLDENDFKKKLRSLRVYNMRAYKYLIFDLQNKLNMENGNHILELPTDYVFKKVYGQIKLKYSVNNNIVVLEDIMPNDILMAGHRTELDTYKGIIVRDEKDIKKIDLVLKMRELKGK